MGGELLEAYRKIEHRQYLLVVCLVISTLVTLLVLIFYSQLSLAGAQNERAYFGLESNYTSLSSSYGSQIASLKGELGSLSARYNQTLYNITNPYTEQLYTNFEVNIPGSSVSVSTTNTSFTAPIPTFNTTRFVKYYTYNFSFNATYPGYILLNATGSSANTRTNSSWEFLVSNGRLITNGTLQYHSFQSGAYYRGAYAPTVTSSGTYLTNLNASDPSTSYAPLPSQASSSIRIPVESGTVHVWIVNFANQSSSVTFSAKYVGFRAS
jgi:hypothetical protein